MPADTYRIACLPGDGIGTEVVQEAVKVLTCTGKLFGFSLTFQTALVGGAAYQATGAPLPAETLAVCDAADAILFGAVGHPDYDRLPWDLRPERALLALRKRYELFANLRPTRLYQMLKEASPLKNDIVADGVDMLIVRELVGGIYFGQPRGVETLPDGTRRGTNTEVYTTPEIERIVRMAFEFARGRRRHLTSVDKANVLESGALWREVVETIAREFSDVTVEHLLVDNAVMQLLRRPSDFDVIVAPNLFGDILSDEGAMITGSIGLLASASLGTVRNQVGLLKGFYEPIHGSAPDIAGKGLANPIATILCGALLLRYSLGLEEAARSIEQAVEETLVRGLRTGDIRSPGSQVVGTVEMGEAIASTLLAGRKPSKMS